MIFNEIKSFLSRKEVIFAISVIGICLLCWLLEVPSNFGTDAWIVIGTIGLMFDALLFDLMAAHYAMLLALAAIMFSQVITTQEALEGFSSSAVLSVAILYVVAAGLTATGGLNYFMNKLLGRPRNLAGAQLRLMLPVAMISAVMNNTPVVAIMIPIIQQWAPKANLSVSQLFIPLSFASILGGACTLIGTSTNLVVAGKAETDLDFKIGLFDIALVGIPALLTGISYIILFAPYLLPNEETILRRAVKNEQSAVSGVDYGEKPFNANYLKSISNMSIKVLNTKSVYESLTVACTVNPTSPAVNKTLAKANLRGLAALYLTSVQRDAQLLQAIGPEFVINENDILFFTGIVDNFTVFCEKMDFSPLTNTGSIRELPNSMSNFELRCNLAKQRASTLVGHMVRALVKDDGFLAGKTPSEVHFRRFYGAAIVSIYCSDTNITTRGNLGRTLLKAGDELDLIVGEEFDWNTEETERDLEQVEVKVGKSKRNEKEKSIEREFLISMKVAETSGLAGVTSLVGTKIVNAGLRGLPGLFLIALERENVGMIRAVSSAEVLQTNDILWFVGERNAFAVLRQIPGLVSANNQEDKLKMNKVDRRLVECVISMNSDMVGKTIREVRFRSRFRAAVVAVHRQGQRVLKAVGDIKLKPGDVLLLDTGPYFLQRFRDDRNFLLVSEIENSGVPQFGKFYLALGLVILMMGLYTLLQSFEDVEVSLFECAILAGAVMIFTNILSPPRAMKSINWEVIIAIACAFGLSTALEKSGVAEAIGTSLVDLAELSGTGETGLFSAIYLATFLVSIVVANNAAALLMFPIATQALTLLPQAQNPEGGEVDLTCKCIRQILYTLMLAASSSFSSPFGYQTNLMVYSPGSYRFGDFLKFGLPMQFWQMAFSITFIVFIDDWYYSWAGAFGLFITVLFVKFSCGRKAEYEDDETGYSSKLVSATKVEIQYNEATL